MASESAATLKTYFETNDVPTQGQYANVMDSFPNVVDENQLQGIDSTVVPVYPPSQGSAYGISKRYNFINSAGTATAAVILPAATAGKTVTIASNVANSVTVYPASGEKFQPIATNGGYLIYQNEVVTFICGADGVWTWISNAPENGHYYVYNVVLNQTSTNAPVATVVTNNFPVSMTWSYNSLGNYTLTGTGFLSVSKSFPLSTGYGSPSGNILLTSSSSPNTYLMRTFNNAGADANNIVINWGLLIKSLRY